MKNLTSKSKFLSLVLRHNPKAAGITLDANGWANVDELLKSKDLQGLTLDDLKTIVENNNKKRFEFNDDFSKIRARQGHSINVDVELSEFIPDKKLYHGTGKQFVRPIIIEGIKKQNRLHVHLSDNISTAITVGERHGTPVVFLIDAVRMYQDGFKFYKSNNDVYLTDYVPPVHLTPLYSEELVSDYYIKCSFDAECDYCDNPKNGSWTDWVFDGECGDYWCGDCASKTIPKILNETEAFDRYLEENPIKDNIQMWENLLKETDKKNNN